MSGAAKATGRLAGNLPDAEPTAACESATRHQVGVKWNSFAWKKEPAQLIRKVVRQRHRHHSETRYAGADAHAHRPSRRQHPARQINEVITSSPSGDRASDAQIGDRPVQVQQSESVIRRPLKRTPDSRAPAGACTRRWIAVMSARCGSSGEMRKLQGTVAETPGERLLQPSGKVRARAPVTAPSKAAPGQSFRAPTTRARADLRHARC